MALTEQEPRTKYYAECATIVTPPNLSTREECGWKSDLLNTDNEADSALEAHIRGTHSQDREPYGYVRIHNSS